MVGSKLVAEHVPGVVEIVAVEGDSRHARSVGAARSRTRWDAVAGVLRTSASCPNAVPLAFSLAPPALSIVRQAHSWHFGYTLNAGSTSVGSVPHAGDGRAGGALPAFVPDRFAPALGRAAQRWSVSAALLAAQLHQESGFNPAAVSGAGAQGIAQFMPSTAAAYGLRNPFDADAAIDAQAHLMRDLLRRFGSVPLALAAYNAGERRVAACMCIPPIPETVAYVAAILGLLHGAGDVMGTGGLTVRLVR